MDRRKKAIYIGTVSCAVFIIMLLIFYLVNIDSFSYYTDPELVRDTSDVIDIPESSDDSSYDNINIDVGALNDISYEHTLGAEEQAENIDSSQIKADEKYIPKLNSEDRQVVGNGKVILFLGSDELAKENARSDIIILAKYNETTGKTTLISLPRDTRVEIPGHGTDKINHAYAFGGERLAIKTVEALFEIAIDYYVKVNFEDFKEIINGFEGVEINSEKRLRFNDGTVLEQGTSVLFGDEALNYVRFRSDNEGDFGRIRRQQEVLVSLAEKSIEFDDDVLFQRISSIYANYLDTDMQFGEILSYAMNDDNYNVIDTQTLKTSSTTIKGVWYELYDQENLEHIKQLLIND